MIGKWSKHIETDSGYRSKLHFFPIPEPGEISLCNRKNLLSTKKKLSFSDPKNYDKKRICKSCVRLVHFVDVLYPGQLKKEPHREVWFNITSKYSGETTAHFFIKNITKSLCGHHTNLTAAAIAEIKFAPVQEKFKNKCKICERGIEFYLKNSKTRTEIKAEKSYAGYETYIPPNANIKPFKISNSPLVWIEVRCTHIEKNGKQCIETGVYPTGDPEKAKDNPHFCLKHNLRVKEAMAT